MPTWVIAIIQMLPTLIQDIITIINAIETGTATADDKQRMINNLEALQKLISAVTSVVAARP